MSKTMKLAFVLAFAMLEIHYPCYGTAILPIANSGDRSYGVEENVVDGTTGNDRPSFEGCLRKDSISCLQMHVFRMAKNFFDQPTLEILNGVSVVKSVEDSDARSNSGNVEEVEEKLEKANSVVEKEQVLESYITEELGSFFERRNINWNLESIGRSLQDGAPEGVKEIFGSLMEEGRGKKKVLRMLLPFLFGLKVKLATVLGLAYLGAVLLAKKALVMSLISIAITIFLLMKKLFSHHEVYAGPQGYNGGWQSHIDVGHVEYAPQSSQVAQTMAYGGQKATTMR